MPGIDENTPVEQVAALVSQALEAAGIEATLSGGGAVSIYSANMYESRDLDFVTSAAGSPSDARSRRWASLVAAGMHANSTTRRALGTSSSRPDLWRSASRSWITGRSRQYRTSIGRPLNVGRRMSIDTVQVRRLRQAAGLPRGA